MRHACNCGEPGKSTSARTFVNPRKSDHAAGELADIMVDALSSDASRKTGGPSETKPGCVSFTFLPEAGVSPQGDHTPPTDEPRSWWS